MEEIKKWIESQIEKIKIDLQNAEQLGDAASESCAKCKLEILREVLEKLEEN